MADVFSKEERSSIMSKVHSKHNKSTELRMILIFRDLGIKGWRRGYNVIGHPDFVFLEKRVAIFVDGCFWHGHNCRNLTPDDNSEYWEKKILHNRIHDEDITKRFASRGWIVIRIWECELKKNNREMLNTKLWPLTETTTDLH